MSSGEGTGSFVSFAALRDANDLSAVFIHERGSADQVEKRLAQLKIVKPAITITTKKIARLMEADAAKIIVGDPRLAFSVLAKAMKIKPPLPIIGKDVFIDETAAIGKEGLSANRLGNYLEHTTHIGGVEIGDHSYIGPFAVIQRAVLGNTRLGTGCHIDCHVVVGHGSTLGERVCVAAHTVICGTCSIGDNAWIGAGSIIRESITIGAGAFVGIGSVVVKDIPAGVMVSGNPAKVMENGRKPW